MSDLDSNIADMNRLLKVYKTFDAESQTAKVLDAEIDRLADAIDTEVKSEAQSLPEGVHLTAERVRGLTFALEAVTSVADVAPELRGAPSTSISRLLKVLRALFPADELAWQKCGSASIGRVCQRLLGHPGNHLHYSPSRHAWKSWPAEPAKEPDGIGRLPRCPHYLDDARCTRVVHDGHHEAADGDSVITWPANGPWR